MDLLRLIVKQLSVKSPGKIGKIFFTFLLCGVLYHLTSAQNLYDLDHSKEYGRYLFDTQQYKLAAEEWERILFMLPENDTARYMVVKSYLLGRDYSRARAKLKQLFPDPVQMPCDYASLYAKSLILLDSIPSAEILLQNNTFLSREDVLYLGLNIELKRNWTQATELFHKQEKNITAIDPRYSEIISMIKDKNSKNPWVAGGMSMIIPGTGKIYAGEWKDGLISLFFVGATVFQSIRGYNQYGPRSGFFITYSSIATAFYLGNIYGSFRAAIRHNGKYENRIKDQIQSVFLDHL
jgi:tetratricopeptide (TPR) repeat protein